jgi:recombination endonuclease VII
MARPRKWPGETQSERTLNRYLAKKAERQVKRANAVPVVRSKYPGSTPQERARARGNAWAERHRERLRAEGRARYASDPRAREQMRVRAAKYEASLTSEQKANRSLRQRCCKYGITVETYQTLLAMQDERCVVCSCTFESGINVAIDHCHVSDVVRGLLCSSCNKALGLAQDSPLVLRAAAAYLREHAEGGAL